MSDTDSLSAEDLRSKLYHSLREKGLVDSLKSQLRNRLVTELKQIGGGQKFAVPEPVYSDHGSLLHKAANSLVAEHLRRCHYDYSLSVFLPECGTDENKIFTTRDLLSLLNVSPHSKLYKNLSAQAVTASSKKGFLWQLLCELAAERGYSHHDAGMQTEQMGLPPPSSLHEKFQQVDDYYSSLAGDSSAQRYHVEERILAYQRQLDERSRTETQLEIARFKENELSRMRLEEKEKCRQEAEITRREMERTYKTRFDALLERERHAIERLQQQSGIAEKETFTQRQTILEEIELVRQREAEMRRTTEINKREKDLWEDKMKTKEQAVKTREDAVRRAELEYEQRYNDAVNKFKLEHESRYMQRHKDIEWREMKVKEDERRVGDDMHDMKNFKDELRDKRIKVAELESDLQKTRRDLLNCQSQNESLSEKLRGMVDYQVLKDEHLMTKKELEDTRNRLAETRKDLMLERQKHEDALRDLGAGGGRAGMTDVMLLQRELEKTRSALRQEQAIAEHRRTETQKKLDEETDRSRNILLRYEEQTKQQQEMNSEMTDLRKHLTNTRIALDNEVYGKSGGATFLSKSRSPSLFGDLDPAGDLDPPRPNNTDLLAKSDSEIAAILKDTDDDLCDAISASEDYSYSMDLVTDTKKRLKTLEQEAQNLEANYRNFQFRVSNVHASLPEPASRPTLYTAPIGTYQSPTINMNRNNAMGSMHSAGLSQSRPLSSTPYRAQGSEVDLHTPPRPTQGSVGMVLDDRPKMDISVSTVNSDPPSPANQARAIGVTSNRAMTMKDLEARPGSPSVMVLGSSGTSREQDVTLTVATNIQHPLVEGKRISPTGQENDAPTAAAVNLNDAWKTRTPTTTSLDDAWKNNRQSEEEKRRKDEEERRQREEEDREYEERKRKREEEKKRREEEAWEREQKELEDLKRKEAGIPSPPPEEEKPEEKKSDDAGAGSGIDPVMQKYMEMVAQQKAREKEVMKKTVDTWNKGRRPSEMTPVNSEQDISGGEEKSAAGGIPSDDDFDW